MPLSSQAQQHAGTPNRLSVGEHLLGLEGLALLRLDAARRAHEAAPRLAEIATIAGTLNEPPFSAARTRAEVDPGLGYALWAAGYDQQENAPIALEGPATRSLLDELPPGPVLDAGCGTGRHSVALTALGRQVIGIDASPEMLALAIGKVPRAGFCLGDLGRLPIASGSMAGVVCALALSHLADLGPAVGELARVLRPGGRLLISVPHPIATEILGWVATVRHPDGRRTVIPEYPHGVSGYLNACAAAGLSLDRCLEPAATPEIARSAGANLVPEAAVAALAGLPVVLVLLFTRQSTP